MVTAQMVIIFEVMVRVVVRVVVRVGSKRWLGMVGMVCLGSFTVYKYKKRLTL